MERMPYRVGFGGVSLPVRSRGLLDGLAGGAWRDTLPVPSAERVVLRELRASDAASLFAALTAPEVSRFISPPPPTVERVEQFIGWAQRQRAAGSYVCFAITVKGSDTAIGLVQVRALDEDFGTAEWGFALASPFWNTGVFVEAANLTMDFAFETLGVHRLEARVAVRNGRGNGALLKIGAVPEATLRESFLCAGERIDQTLYAVVADDWRASRPEGWGAGAVRTIVH